jgi:hypothetical protein
MNFGEKIQREVFLTDNFFRFMYEYNLAFYEYKHHLYISFHIIFVMCPILYNYCTCWTIIRVYISIY